MGHFISYTCGEAPRKFVEEYVPWNVVYENTGKRSMNPKETSLVLHVLIQDNNER